MRFRRSRWSIAVLSVLLNLGGGPMAWAHALGDAGSCHESRPAVEAADADCHGEHTVSKPERAQGSHPCCDGGSCSCAAPALSVALVAQSTPALRVEFVAAHDTSALPARLLDDTLRPPIR